MTPEIARNFILPAVGARDKNGEFDLVCNPRDGNLILKKWDRLLSKSESFLLLTKEEATQNNLGNVADKLDLWIGKT